MVDKMQEGDMSKSDYIMRRKINGSNEVVLLKRNLPMTEVMESYRELCEYK